MFKRIFSPWLARAFSEGSPIFILLFLGLIIRLIFIPAAGFEADIAYWKWWGEAASKGPAYALSTTSINYPPFFIYILGLIWKIYTIFAPLETAKNVYQTNTFIFLLIVKLPAILCDLATAYGIYWLLKKITSSSQKILNPKYLILNTKYLIPVLGAALYLFNPVVIFDSAYWGQTDSIAVALVLASLITLLKGKVFLTFVIAIIALETKVQTVVFTPFLFLLTLRWFGLKKLIEALSVSAATFLAINLPYILSHTMVRAMSIILESSSYFPLASLNAYNFWWIVTRGNGFYTSDATLIGNAITYKTLGMLAYWTIYFLIATYLWQKSKIPNTKYLILNTSPINSLETHNYQSLFLAFSAAAFAFFMLPTQIHERYLFPLFLWLTILLALVVAKYLAEKGLKNRVAQLRANVLRVNVLLVTFYLLLITSSSFLNLHLVLVLNYPENGLPIISGLNKPGIYLPTTLFLSWLNVFLFLALLWIVLKQVPRKIFKGVFMALVGLILLELALSFLNRQKEVILLSSLKPSYVKQDWGNLKINKTVDDRLLSSSFVWYNKGLGTHANSKIVYNLAGRYEKFTTDIGVDTEAADNASVEFIIEGDGKALYKSPVMKKWNWPLHAEIPIKNIKTLTLLTTDAGDGKNGDHADWLNPKLYK